MTETTPEFDQLDWHDAVLLEVIVDRSSPGTKDTVSLLIEWRGGRRQRLTFRDCYALHADMNFGVVAEETVRQARCRWDSPLLTELQQAWLRTGAVLSDVQCFEIETNSTASVLRVLARSVVLTDA